jgi:WD40 repeat protein
MTSMPKMEPPHQDVVTTLKFMGDTLISGSRDKSLMAWDPKTYSYLGTEVKGAHNDWINTLESDIEGKYLYSGGKEGVVKIWQKKRN